MNKIICDTEKLLMRERLYLREQWKKKKKKKNQQKQNRREWEKKQKTRKGQKKKNQVGGSKGRGNTLISEICKLDIIT